MHSEAIRLVLDDDGGDEDYEFDDDFDLNTCSDEEKDSNDHSEYADSDHNQDLSQLTENYSWCQANNETAKFSGFIGRNDVFNKGIAIPAVRFEPVDFFTLCYR